MFTRLLGVGALIATTHSLLTPSAALACGCFSPPVPPPDSSNYAVNQQAEQIVFEVNEEDGTVTAHVLILYQGDPESFAWLLPAPNAPELGLSEDFTFALLDELTRPQVSVRQNNVCPSPEFRCEYRDECPRPDFMRDDSPSPGGFADAGAAADSGFGDAGGGAPPVEVISRETIGAYDTIVFSAGDTAAAVEWLQAEGFIVNETTAPFMQPYADEGMVFVAARLVPGADLDQIRPLKMTYEGLTPMIPLRITAVGTEPELAVTAYIYGDENYLPMGDHEVLNGSLLNVSDDGTGRTNYPSALSRAIDEAGGDAFIVEYAGEPVRFFPQGGCCGGGFDACGIGGNDRCECPGDEFDATDCEAELPGFELLSDLADRHPRMTRITTRLSAHEMTFDPMFEPGPRASSRLAIQGTRTSIDACRDAIADDEGEATADELADRQLCATTYCGEGECVITSSGPGCLCNEGFVARAFTDLDGSRNVTCIPAEHPVDLSAGGLEIKSSCDDTDCGAGSCIDHAGFPTCACDADHAAVADTPNPTCLPIALRTGDVGGGGDYSAGLAGIDICWPEPPSCGPNGWLVRRTGTARQGVACGWNEPTEDELRPLPPLDCGFTGTGSLRGGGEACSAGGAESSAPFLLAVGGVLAWIRRRR
ncbi:MAG: DUF2330 domain-containing protein [Myxococcota bacterium]